MTSKQPDIMFLFRDNLSWGEAGCYGAEERPGRPDRRLHDQQSNMADQDDRDHKSLVMPSQRNG